MRSLAKREAVINWLRLPSGRAKGIQATHRNTQLKIFFFFHGVF